MSYKRARIQGNDNGPAFLDSHGAPSGVRYQVEITVLQDDVTTVAFIANKQTGDQLAVGYAKRHKADARNPEVGKDLALARAFKDLGQRYATKAERGLHPDPDPMREPLRACCADLALKGVRAEYGFGLRSTLDILVADESLRAAQLAEARSRSDLLIAEGALLRATGKMDRSIFG